MLCHLIFYLKVLKINFLLLLFHTQPWALVSYSFYPPSVTPHEPSSLFLSWAILQKRLRFYTSKGTLLADCYIVLLDSISTALKLMISSLSAAIRLSSVAFPWASILALSTFFFITAWEEDTLGSLVIPKQTQEDPLGLPIDSFHSSASSVPLSNAVHLIIPVAEEWMHNDWPSTMLHSLRKWYPLEAN